MKKKRYSLGIGLNLFDARAILLDENGEVVTHVERKRKDVNANETIQVILELFESILDIENLENVEELTLHLVH